MLVGCVFVQSAITSLHMEIFVVPDPSCPVVECGRPAIKLRRATDRVDGMNECVVDGWADGIISIVHCATIE